MKKIILLIMITAVLSIMAASEPDTAAFRKIDKLISKDMKTIEYGGISFALGSESEILFSKGYGMADSETGLEMSAETPLAVASVTKLFTATALVQLAEEGKLNLDIPVSHYIPDFSLKGTADEEVTPRLLLTHYSPLPSDILKGYIVEEADREDPHAYMPAFLDTLREEQGIGNGGDFYRYSNVGYELASYMVSLVSGISFSDYIEANILTPLNMSNSGFDSDNSLRSRIAKGYNDDGETPLIPMRGTGEGDLISSAGDLIRFSGVFTGSNKNILEESSIEMMLSKHNEHNRYDFDLYRGLGWYRMEIPGYEGHYAYYHEGGTHPYSSLLVIIPEFSLSFSLLANENEHGFDALSADILKVLMENITGEKPEDQMKLLDRSEELDSDFFGIYSTEMGMMTISDSLTGPRLEMMGMKLNLKRERDGYYGLQYRIFGLIPLPIADLRGIKIKFQRKDFDSFAIYTSGKYRGLGTRIEKDSIDPAWEERLGSYTIVNNDEKNFLSSFSLSMDRETMQPLLKVSVATIPGILTFPVNMSNGERAYIEGNGRHLGDSISVIENTRGDLLRYSGFYLMKD